MDTRSQPVLIKIALIGETNSGKSSLVSRLTLKSFSSTSEATIGVKISSHKIEPSVELQIFDTAGDKRFQTPFNFSHLHTIFITCDLTNANSLNSIHGYLEQIKKNSKSKLTQQIILVGTKDERPELRQIDVKTFAEAARGFNLPYIETSSLANFNVDELFQLPVKHWQPLLAAPDHIALDDTVQIKTKNNTRGFFKNHQNLIAYAALVVAIIAIIITLSTGIAAPLIGALVAVGVGAALAAVITHTIAFIAGLLGGALLGTAAAAIIDALPWRRNKAAELASTPSTSNTSAALLKQMGADTRAELGKGAAYESELLGHSARSEEPSIHSSNEVVDIESLTPSSGSMSPR